MRIQQAAGEAGTHLVGIADAVGADIAVGAKQLHGIEVRKRAVEHRQLVLVAIGDVEVLDAWLERQLALLARAAVALEHQAGV